MEEKESFLQAIEDSVLNNQFVKITLSKAYPKTSDLHNIYIRKIELKGDLFLSFTYHYATKDIVKNYTLKAAKDRIALYLGQDFLAATLLTTAFDLLLQYNKKRKIRLQKRKASTQELPPV